MLVVFNKIIPVVYKVKKHISIGRRLLSKKPKCSALGEGLASIMSQNVEQKMSGPRGPTDVRL